MTAILGISYDGCPVLMGDLLLSTPASEAKLDAYVPTVGRVGKLGVEAYGRSISGMTQKICVLGPNLAVACAGNGFAAAAVMKELRQRSKRKTLSRQEVEKFFSCELNAFLGGLALEVSFIGVHMCGDQFFHFGVNSEKFSLPFYGLVRIAGTGTDDIRRHLLAQSCPNLSTSYSALSTSAVAATLMLSGNLLQHEMSHAKILDAYASLHQFYGGGYELVTIRENGLAKIDDLMFLMWSASVTGGEVLIQAPHCVFKYSYVDDLLIIRTLRYDYSGPSAVVQSDEYTVVPPLYRDPTEEEVRSMLPPPLDSQIFCHYFLLKNANGEMVTLTRIDFANPSAFKMLETRDSRNFVYHSAFLESVSQGIRQAYDGDVKPTQGEKLPGS